jgi:ribosomal protein S18 acetylase RimI-like enzyme
MIETNGLLRINKNLVKPASICCARAFQDDPYTLHLIPDKRKRSNLRYGFAYYLNLSVNGSAETYTTSPGCEGVAMWVPPGLNLPLWSFLRGGNPFLPLRCGWRYVYGEFLANRYCQKIKDKYAPERYLYLALLAVDPAFQGKGFASLLLKQGLRKADDQHLPCYLETQNRKNEAMYWHFGFKTVFEAEYPGTHSPIIAMLRDSN